MSVEPRIERRLPEGETPAAERQRRLPPPAPDWLERVIGSFRDEPAFDEVLSYGRAFRTVDRPPVDDES